MNTTTPISAPAVDSRWRLTRDVERFPHFTAPAGAEGTIVSVDEWNIVLKLDEHLDGAEEWDNAVVWSPEDDPETDTAAVAFAADCQVVLRPGVDTPREDDIITPCCGPECRCNGWVVSAHPRYVRGGGQFIGGKLREWKPTPEWVEAEAARIANSKHANVGCGGPPVVTDEEVAAFREETDRINALRDFGGEAV